MGSTSNLGAITLAGWTAFCSSTIEAIPSAAPATAKLTPIRRFRVILSILQRSDVSYSKELAQNRARRETITNHTLVRAAPFALDGPRRLGPWEHYTRFGLIPAAILALAGIAAAHDIPNDVTVQAFFKPSGQRLRLLVRVPLKAMRDIVFPERGPGYLDLPQVDPLLPGQAMLWLGNFIDVYEGNTSLARPVVAATRLSLESDRSFTSFEQALAHLTGPRLTNETNVV